MFRKLVCALVVMTVTVGFVLADEYSGVLKNVDGNKITVHKTKKVDNKNQNDGDPVVLTVASDAVIAKERSTRAARSSKLATPRSKPV